MNLAKNSKMSTQLTQENKLTPDSMFYIKSKSLHCPLPRIISAMFNLESKYNFIIYQLF